MLELPRLLLLSRTDRDAPRRIVDPATGDAVGSLRRRPLPTSVVARLIATPTWEVREAIDEPLLFTMRRLWGWGVVWQVREADGHRVATVTRGEVRNRGDLRLARLTELPQRQELEMRGQDGQPLAVLRRGDDGDVLTFEKAIDGNPYAKMALLAAALVRELG